MKMMDVMGVEPIRMPGLLVEPPYREDARVWVAGFDTGNRCLRLVSGGQLVSFNAYTHKEAARVFSKSTR